MVPFASGNPIQSISPSDVWLRVGNKSMQNGNYERSIFCYSEAAKADNTSAASWYKKGLALGSLAKLNESIDCFETAIFIDSSNPSPWFSKGLAFCALAKYNEAIECFNKAIDINPSDPSPWFGKSLSLCGLGEYNEAIECSNKAANIDPIFSSSLWCTKGLALNAVGEYNESLEYCNKAIDIEPTLSIAWIIRSYNLCNLGKTDAAKESYKYAINLDPKSEITSQISAALCFNSTSLKNHLTNESEPILRIQNAILIFTIIAAIATIIGAGAAIRGCQHAGESKELQKESLDLQKKEHYEKHPQEGQTRKCDKTHTWEIYHKSQGWFNTRIPDTETPDWSI